MTYCNIAVGAADDAGFLWEGGDYGDNIPRVILNLGSISLDVHVKAARLLEASYGGKQLDWGATGARLTKSSIKRFLRECGHSDEWVRDAVTRVAALPHAPVYILFVFES